MRIINAMFGRGLGGIEQALVDYCEALQLASFEVCALIHPKAAIRAVLEERNIPYRTLSNFGAWDLFAIWRLKKLLRAMKPDACIAHGNRAVSLLACAGAAKLVAVTHNYKIKCKKAAAVFCPTQDLVKYAEGQGVEEERIHVIPNMVRAVTAPRERVWRAPPVIGAMGRFVAKKGFDVFIEAVAILKSQGAVFRAVLAGDGEETAALKALAAEKNLGDVLYFPGWVEDKKPFFDGIDIFCLPSHHEPFGIVLLEAMAQGLPVVSTDSEGPSEIIEHGVDGVLVPKADPTALAQGLALMLADPGAALAIAKKAAQTVKREYDLMVVSAALAVALYKI